MLRDALALSRPAVVSLIGAGGKTSLLYRLGKELAAEGEPVLLTTTTRMYVPAAGEADEVVLARESADPLAQMVADRLRPGRRVFVARPGEAGKVKGLASAEVDMLARYFSESWVVVEADGAAQRLLKGYAAHEPAVPPASRLVVALAGLEVLGRPLDPRWAHRPERVAEVTGLKLGERIRPRDLAAALAEGLKRALAAAPRARALAWLNRPGPGTLAGARAAARRLLSTAPAERVILGDARKGAVGEIWPGGGGGPYGVAAVVLAAGSSCRFPGNKLLQPLGDKALVEHAVDTALACPLEPVVVVLGHQAQEVAAKLAGRPVKVVHNPSYREGQSTSLKAGLAALPPEIRAAAFFLADLPLIRPATVEALLAAYLKTGAAALYPAYAGRPGHPVLFDRRLFPALGGTEGDEGGRRMLAAARAVPVTDPGVLLDVDTPEDLERLRQMLAEKSNWR